MNTLEWIGNGHSYNGECYDGGCHDACCDCTGTGSGSAYGCGGDSYSDKAGEGYGCWALGMDGDSDEAGDGCGCTSETAWYLLHGRNKDNCSGDGYCNGNGEEGEADD